MFYNIYSKGIYYMSQMSKQLHKTGTDCCKHLGIVWPWTGPQPESILRGEGSPKIGTFVPKKVDFLNLALKLNLLIQEPHLLPILWLKVGFGRFGMVRGTLACTPTPLPATGLALEFGLNWISIFKIWPHVNPFITTTMDNNNGKSVIPRHVFPACQAMSLTYDSNSCSSFCSFFLIF